METFTRTLSPVRSISGVLTLPGDKSISHRALILGCLARGTTRISGLLNSADVLSTRRCLEQLGANFIDRGPSDIEVNGLGKDGLKRSRAPLDCGNSGTTLRLLMGVLSGQPFDSELIGDASLSRRPMKRVADPLRKMGATIRARDEEYAPVHVQALTGGRELTGIDYELPIASAQIKSALLLGGFFARGVTRLRGKIHSRDHTERLLRHFGVHLGRADDMEIVLEGGQPLRGAEVRVPGDFSAAAFWIAAATLVRGASIELRGVSLNPTRTGFLRALQRMGAAVEVQLEKETPEPVGALRIRHAPLSAIRVSGREIPELIDELPILAVLATQAHGLTEVRDARELRVKETDRIQMVAGAIRAMGAEITVYDDGFSIQGPQALHGGTIETGGDHRIAMAFSIAALIARGATQIVDPACVAVSYPRFYETLEELAHA